jgi:hypothetical protein
VRNVSLLRDVRWGTQSCTIGWSLSGLMPEAGESHYELRAASRMGKEVVVAGTSWGELRLSRYPSVEDARSKVIRAHVSAVSAVKYAEIGSANRCCVFSAGGAELTIFLWRVRKSKAAGADARAPDNGAQAPALSQLAKRFDDVRLLSEPLSPGGGLGGFGVLAEKHGSEAWRSAMLNPPLDTQLHLDVVPTWGSSFSRMALKDLDIRLERVQGYR